jgi:hypothetical protein
VDVVFYSQLRGQPGACGVRDIGTSALKVRPDAQGLAPGSAKIPEPLPRCGSHGFLGQQGPVAPAAVVVQKRHAGSSARLLLFDQLIAAQGGRPPSLMQNPEAKEIAAVPYQGPGEKCAVLAAISKKYSRGDLNTRIGEISPVQGNHAIRLCATQATGR